MFEFFQFLVARGLVELSSLNLQKNKMDRELNMGRQEARENKIDTQSDERARQFTKIMNSCTININKAINNLVQEVWDLQAKERNELIETVNSLQAKLSLIEPVQTNVESHQNVVDLDGSDESLADSEDDYIETPKISNDSVAV